jgi:ribosome-associated protein
LGELAQKDFMFYARLSLEELDRYCTHQTARSSGPGGQGVNTTDSKVLTRFNPNPAIRAVSQRERSQYLNRKANLQKIHKKLLALSTPTKQRIGTKPSKAANAKRLAAKTHRSTIKKSRRKNFDEE